LKPVVLVTGGSRGIGAATAVLAAQQGWAVAVNYSQDAAAAQAVVARIQAAGGLSLAVQADVGDEAQVMAMFAHIDQALPAWGACWAGLVNSAGVVDQAQRVEAMSVQRLERMMRINVIGSMVCAREAIRRNSAGQAGPSSTSAAWQPDWAGLASMWTMPPAKGRLKASPWAWLASWPPTASA